MKLNESNQAHVIRSATLENRCQCNRCGKLTPNHETLDELIAAMFEGGQHAFHVVAHPVGLQEIVCYLCITADELEEEKR